MDVMRHTEIRRCDVTGRVSLTHDEVKRFSARMHDFFFTRTSETVDEIGTAALLVDSIPNAVFSGFILRGRLKRRDTVPEFLIRALQTQSAREQIVSTATYTTRALTNGRSLGRVTVALPSVDEQKAIARALRDVDSLIDSMEHLTAKKRAIKQGMMQELLTGRTRLPGFTEPWAPVRLSGLGEFLRGRGVTRDQVRPSGVPCIRYGELYTTYTGYTASTVSFVESSVAASALPIHAGDILFAGSGETKEEIGTCVAYIGNAPAVAGGDIIVLRGAKYEPVYLASLLNTPALANRKARGGQGDAVVHINWRVLAGLEVDLPELPEQRAIADVLRDADHELDALGRRLEAARAIKQGMMQELLTGRTRLVPTEASA